MKKVNTKNLMNLITCAVFLTFIFSYTVRNLLTPEKTFSENENRVLAKAPDASIKNILFGDFDTEFENWFSDQFIGRDGWIQAKSTMRRTAGAIENNEVYFGGNGRLIQQFLDFDRKILDSNISYVNQFAQDTGIKLNIMLVPGASQGEKKYLPLFASNVNEAKLLEEIASSFSGQNFIDAAAKIGTGQDMYFRTDHHWNAAGAYAGYTAICQSVLNKEPEEFTYTKVSDDFRGTMYSRSGAFRTKGDELFRMDPRRPFRVQITYENGSTSDSLFVESRLQEKDKYTYYIDGNHAHVSIKTDNPSGKKAVLIKDSFSHILVPYLCAEYSEIELFDLRYYRDQVSKSITDPAGTDVYLIYGLETFCTDTSLAVLW